MAIHLNPFRFYKNVAQLNHGALVEMLRNTHIFWDTYKELLKANNKKKSDVADLHKIMVKLGKVPEAKRAVTAKEQEKIIKRVQDDFDLVTKNLEAMMQSLDVIIAKDQMFFFKAFTEIEKLYWRIGRIEHLPTHMADNVQMRLYSILAKMVEKEHHSSQIAKGHARGFFKIADLSWSKTWREKRRIKKQTIELDHIRDAVEPLQERIDRMSFVKGEELHKLQEEIATLIEFYHKELDDLAHIIHEADVLIYRTEQLFKAMQKEAAELGHKEIKDKTEECAKIFHKILNELSIQSGREYRDMHSRFQHIPVPKVQKMAA